MKDEIQKILDRNFTRGDNAKALKELLELFQSAPKKGKEIIPKSLTLKEICKRAWFDGFWEAVTEDSPSMQAFLNWWETKYQPEEIRELEIK